MWFLWLSEMVQGICGCWNKISAVHLNNQLLFNLFQNLNKQAYDLAKTLLKRTVQTIETCIANVSSSNCDSLAHFQFGNLIFSFLPHRLSTQIDACTQWDLIIKDLFPSSVLQSGFGDGKVISQRPVRARLWSHSGTLCHRPDAAYLCYATAGIQTKGYYNTQSHRCLE